MVARKIQVSGRVQGVGFRFSAALMARQLGVQGWVANEADGSVRAHAQGEAAAVEDFCRWMGKGPPGAMVVKCHVHDAVPDPLCLDFRVEHSR